MNNYSKRIRKIAEMILPCRVLCDIGCDHGYMSLLALQGGKAEEVLACDIHEGPLRKAEQNLREAGFSDRVEFILSDGFSEVNRPFDACIISGMGGLLIKEILKGAGQKLEPVRQLLLSPHSEAYALRRYLYEETDFTIQNETCLEEGGKFYTVWDVRRGQETLKTLPPESILRYGDPALQNDRNIYREMIEDLYRKKKDTLSKIMDSDSNKAARRKEELFRETEALLGLLET